MIACGIEDLRNTKRGHVYAYHHRNANCFAHSISFAYIAWYATLYLRIAEYACRSLKRQTRIRIGKGSHGGTTFSATYGAD